MPETDKWEFKLDEAKQCWKDLKTFSATGCADADAVAAADAVVPDKLGVGEFDKGKYIKECTKTTFTIHEGADKQGAIDQAEAAKIYTITYDSTAGKVGCTGWGATPTVWFTFTSAAWKEKSADADADATSGAMSLASAVAAGAMAVAATQF